MLLKTNPDRQLQGASPWLINDLKYDLEFSKRTNLLSIMFMERIFAGTNGLDHYEQTI
jgi:hypothetical protein